MTNPSATLSVEHPGLPARLALALRDIKIAHSVFALPFAILAAFLATPALGAAGPADRTDLWKRFALQLALVVACMVAARTWAMLVNRIADHRLDAANPRTARRAVASGALRQRDALGFAIASALAFFGCCAGFLALDGNAWPLMLALPTLVWIAFYSFTKRFTALCHLFLGGALAASPLAAAIAVRPESLADTPALWAIAAMVVLWVAGFDILYALQDVEFDREAGLFSLPARLGPRTAVWLSRAMHAGAAGALLLAWRFDARLGALFLSACVVIAALLVLEHVVLARKGLRALPIAFFTINGVVSCLLGVVGVADLLLRA
ncbi:MAG: 4-hydroxybenzoate octaprenyltransferase [Phycisphaerales bacterium]